MPTPGIADPYWFEWYVGLDNIIKMIDPDNEIDYVIFQSKEYSTIDDVVVVFKNEMKEVCYQVKHEISTSNKTTITFKRLLEKLPDKSHCLLTAMALGWKEACASTGHLITPILYTNRRLGPNKVTRKFKGISYKAYPVDVFFSLLKKKLSTVDDAEALSFDDPNLSMQWEELCDNISLSERTDVITFIKAFELRGNQSGLEETEQKLIESIAHAFSCTEAMATELFIKLIAGLRIWTTTRRTSQKVTIEDVYSVLGADENLDQSQHRLVPPYPFFLSRKEFCAQLVDNLKATDKKVAFISGEPGSGKTSVISYIQSEYNLFLLRFHTFKPISPEQHFYNLDEGMCTTENLWGTLLTQLRICFKGRLAECQVPLNNKFCSAEGLRDQVCRLLGILGEEALRVNKKVFVCIDGIDHAARARTQVSFLSSLLVPEEIPNGVCFVIVGQPTDLYQAQYPAWLSTSDAVMRINVPVLCVDDIQELVAERAPQFSSEIDSVANLVFKYTHGNNLSTVFAVEELRDLRSYGALVEYMEKSGISHDIQQYYHHIWNYIREEMSKIGLGIPYPESIVACPILLMNGRISTHILSAAIPCALSEADWKQIFSRLYPVIIPNGNDGEFSIFHNDFRVFLMGIISGYQAKFQEIALQLAEYLFTSDEGLVKYVMTIPLLCCAERRDLIPKYFTPDFVIGALSEGISKERLDEYAKLSYDGACSSRNIELFCSTYFSLKTIYQHEQYYEYYNRFYYCADNPNLESIDISEIQAQPLTEANLDEYSNVLTRCRELNRWTGLNASARALSLYNKWFGSLLPTDFLPLYKGTVDDKDPWNLHISNIGLLLQEWGSAVAELRLELPDIDKATTDWEDAANSCFFDAFFKTTFQKRDYDRAILALDKGYVSKTCFEEHLATILNQGIAEQFKDYLAEIAQKAAELSTQLYAAAILALNGIQPPFSEDVISDPIKHIYDDASFTMVLYAFLVGYVESASDEAVICGHTKLVYQSLESEEDDLYQVSRIVRLASLLGKYQAQPTTTPSEVFVRHISWFFTEKPRRSFDYSKARSFLLFAILNGNEYEALFNDEKILTLLENSMYGESMLYWSLDNQKCILDFLKKHGCMGAIKNCILSLYGADGSQLFQNENYAEMHEVFSQYGEVVCPQIMETVTSKLKWDIVGYTGHKEYALQVPYDSFTLLAEVNPSVWRESGRQIYLQSLIADRSNNQYSYDIQKSIVKAAAQCGLADFWELHLWNQEFRLDPDLLDLSIQAFAMSINNEEDFVALWILNCGLHSWYTQEERLASVDNYKALEQGSELSHVDFPALVSTWTPEWFKIIQHELKTPRLRIDSTTEEFYKKKAQALAIYQTMGNTELLEALSQLSSQEYAEERITVITKLLMERDALDQEISKTILRVACRSLKGDTWVFDPHNSLIQLLIRILPEDAFWTLAEIIGQDLSEYSYQISVRNMQSLIKLNYEHSTEFVNGLFEQELSVQRMWVTGNGHIEVAETFHPISGEFGDPNSYCEMVLYILLEQIETHNARKIESAIYSIYQLGRLAPITLKILSSHWDVLSFFQKEMLLFAVRCWISNGTDELHELCNVLLKEYSESNSLEYKYFLHSVLSCYDPNKIMLDQIDCTALTIEYELPDASFCSSDGPYERFLCLTEYWHGISHMNDDIRKAIQLFCAESVRHTEPFGKRGDYLIPASNKVASQILYGEDAQGRWADIPLNLKKSWLLPSDDPFLLTEMPTIVYDEDWVSNSDETSKTVDMHQLSEMIRKNCLDNEEVLGACIWFPYGHDDGIIYSEVAEVGPDVFLLAQSNTVEQCLGNFGMLNGNLDEMHINQYGVQLFKLARGSSRFFHGNCQIAPSRVWHEAFGCNPDANSPYIWKDDADRIVLHFERIAFPTREVRYEKYFRQPILFRWLCDSNWLQNKLNTNKLHIRHISCEEKMP